MLRLRRSSAALHSGSAQQDIALDMIEDGTPIPQLALVRTRNERAGLITRN